MAHIPGPIRRMPQAIAAIASVGGGSPRNNGSRLDPAGWWVAFGLASRPLAPPIHRFRVASIIVTIADQRPAQLVACIRYVAAYPRSAWNAWRAGLVRTGCISMDGRRLCLFCSSDTPRLHFVFTCTSSFHPLRLFHIAPYISSSPIPQCSSRRSPSSPSPRLPLVSPSTATRITDSQPTSTRATPGTTTTRPTPPTRRCRPRPARL